MSTMLRRRDILGLLAGAMLSVGATGRKMIATVTTEYRRDSHADVIVGRLLEGYDYEGIRRSPSVQVISMYTDQVPNNDMSRPMASKHGVKICSTVREALTLGTNRLAVEGVVLIGEHGNYPENEKGQKLYPRYELYKQIIEVFRQTGQVAPVFCDKHLSVDWDKAQWMVAQSRQLKFPLMAGSSLPLAWRRPPLELDLETPVEKAVVCYYGGKEAYGFHALEALQCMVERRRGGETGLAAVQCLEGKEIWRWTTEHTWAARLLEVALARCESRKPGSPQGNVKNPIMFWLNYRSGLEAAVFLLGGDYEDSYIDQAGFAADITEKSEPVSTEMWLQPVRPYSHFSALTHYIEQLIVTGKPAYPVERTLLTTGVLVALMDSSFQKSRRLETPHLNVAYRAPKESLFSRGPAPTPEGQKS